MPLKVAEMLRGCLSGRSKFWTVPGVKHNGAAAGAKDEYHRRIWPFFQRHLDGGRIIRHAGMPNALRQAAPQREPSPTV